MIETEAEARARMSKELAIREAAAKRYADKQAKRTGMVTQPSMVTQPAPNMVAQPKRDRAAYFRAYRSRTKSCPHCGGEL